MPQISFAIIITHFTINPIINRRKIIFPFFVINIYYAFAGKQHSIAAIPGRHYTIKHIYT